MTRQTLAIVLAILGMGAMIALALGLAISLRPNASTDTGSPGLNCGPPPAAPGPTKAPDKKEELKSPFKKYRKAAIQSDTKVCSEIGMDVMLGRGGSATDAAIAVMMCTSTTLFHGAGLGGGLFMTVYDRERASGNQVLRTLLAREVMPAVGHRDYYLTHSSLHGGTAVGVPGIVHGMYTAWELYGRTPWAELIAPSIKLAEDGFPVVPDLMKRIHAKKDRMSLPANQNLRKVCTKPDGSLVTVGDVIKRPKFAETLRRVAADPLAFYNGTLADDVIADIAEAGGEMVKRDLQGYRTRVTQPIRGELRNLKMTMYSPEAPSSGVVLQFILRIIDGFGFDKSSLKDVDTAATTYHKMIEAFKFGFGRRSALADPQFWDIAEIVRNMTDEDFIAATRNKIDTAQTHDLDYYDHGYDIVEDSGTSHFSVLSPDGSGVGVTATINYYFGSEVYGSRTGIMFNNEMDDFSIPGKANVWKIAPSLSNFPEPGKMPMSSMSPTIFLDEKGKVAYIIGASGGPKIISSIVYVALHNLYLGLDLGTSVDRPRLHHQLLPNIVKYEPGVSQELLEVLKSLGHKLEETFPLGYCSGIRNYCTTCRDACSQNCIHAISDRRKSGEPYGY